MTTGNRRAGTGGAPSCIKRDCSDEIDRRADRRSPPDCAAALVGHHIGLATISDGVCESILEVEIHTRPGQAGTVAAWHVTIRGKLPHQLRSPHGKALSVVLADGSRGVGTLVDPHVIRGAGEPPCA